MKETNDPSGTPPPRKKRWSTKVRTGCLTCRRRRVKCDETKPHCNRCVAVSRPCVGPYYGSSYQGQTYPGYSTDKHGSVDFSTYIYKAPTALVQFSSSTEMADLCLMLPLLQGVILSSNVLPTAVDVMMALSAGTMYQYFDNLPCRAGYEASLDRAAVCVRKALRERLARPSISLQSKDLPLSSLSTYVDALQELRNALADPTRCQRPEVLCAIQLLGLFELTVQNRPRAPSQHVVGAGDMIKYRGHANFNNEFEYNLLVAQIPTILAQSFFTNQQPFLVQPAWMSVLEACAQSGANTPGEQSIRMHILQIMACSIAVDASPYLTSGIYDSVEHDELLTRCDQVIGGFTQWRRRYGVPSLSELPAHTVMSAQDESTVCIMDSYASMLYRLHVSLGGDDAVQMEQDTQQLAHSAVEICTSDSGADGFVPKDAHAAIALNAASAILATETEYAEFAMMSDKAAAAGERRSLLPAHIYTHFMCLNGYAPPDGTKHEMEVII